jgi:hypothetical protein
MDPETRSIPVVLANGAVIYVETAVLGEEEVAFENLSFEGVIAAIEGISQSVVGALRKVKPSKASVELGLEVGLDAGKLIALLAKVDSKANLKIRIEWEQQKASPRPES